MPGFRDLLRNELTNIFRRHCCGRLCGDGLRLLWCYVCNEQGIGIQCSGANGATSGLHWLSGQESKSKQVVRVGVLHDFCVHVSAAGKMVVRRVQDGKILEVGQGACFVAVLWNGQPSLVKQLTGLQMPVQ